MQLSTTLTNELINEADEKIDIILLWFRYSSCESTDCALYRFAILQREVSVPLELYRPLIAPFHFPKKIIHRINYTDIPPMCAKDNAKHSGWECGSWLRIELPTSNLFHFQRN